MTILDIVSTTKDMLTPDDVAEVLGSDPATIRETVKQDPAALAPLQPVRLGNRVKFPRKRFLDWLGEEQMRFILRDDGVIETVLLGGRLSK